MSEASEKNSLSGTPADRDWDPSVALARVAGGDVMGFTARLHAAAEAYARFPQEHLTFEEIQQFLSGDPNAAAAQNAHLEACEFCSGLCETLTTSDSAKQAFTDLVKGYERTPEKQPVRIPEPIRTHDKSKWRSPRATHSGWQWGLGLAAAVVIGIGLGSVGTLKFEDAKTVSTIEPPIGSSNFIVKPRANWDTVRASCARQTGQQQSCALFADAAQLQIDGKTQTVRPVVVDGLKKSGASSSVVSHVDRTLEIPTDPDPLARERAVSEARAVLAKSDGSNPDQLLQVAKLQFEGGQPVVGYEFLKAYVAADNPSAGKALQIAFVGPVTLIQHQRAGSSPTSSNQALDSQAVATDGSKDAKN